MIAEAVDTVITLGWALAAWIAVLAMVASIVLLAGTAVGMWAVRGAWRVLRARMPRRGAVRPPGAPNAPSRDSRDAGTPPGASQGPYSASPPRVPAWAHTDHHQHEDAA